jgi:hypothetical protein
MYAEDGSRVPVPDPSVRQLWFAGAHSDVGGGYGDQDVDLSFVPRHWLVGEAMRLGLRVGQAGQQELGQRADPLAPDHESLSEFWRDVQHLPALRAILRPIGPDQRRDPAWQARGFPAAIPGEAVDASLRLRCGQMVVRITDESRYQYAYKPENLWRDDGFRPDVAGLVEPAPPTA